MRDMYSRSNKVTRSTMFFIFVVSCTVFSTIASEAENNLNGPESLGQNVEFCSGILGNKNASLSTIEACLKSERRNLNRGKQAVYMRKLWRAFSLEKDNPGSTTHIAHGRRPYAVNKTSGTITFNRCPTGHNIEKERYQEDNLTRLELVVPHSLKPCNESEAVEDRQMIVIDVNGRPLEPTEATVVVKGTLTFDLTYLASDDQCQALTIVFHTEPGVSAYIDKAYLYEYYNLDEDSLSNFRNMTQRMYFRKKNVLKKTVIQQRAKRQKRRVKKCGLRPFIIDLNELSSMGTVIHPRYLDVKECDGGCSLSTDIFGASEYNTIHAIMLNNLDTGTKCSDGRLGSCVPYKMQPETIQFYAEDFSVITKTFSAMSIRSCRCV